MKKAIMFICMILLFSYVYADSYIEVSQFTDGTSAFNISANITKYISIPANSTIFNASLTIMNLSFPYSYNFTNGSSINWTGGDRIPPLDPSKLYDNNWNTYADNDGDNLIFLINYTNTSDKELLWSIRDGSGYANLSSAGCENNNTQLRIVSWFHLVSPFSGASWECYDEGADAWIVLRNESGDSGDYHESWVYEETLWYRYYTENITIKLNDTIVYSRIGRLNTTLASIDLNITVIQNYTDQNGTLPIHFHADLHDIWEISNLSINYVDLWECDGRPGEVVAYNFTLKDENNDTLLTGDISVDLTYLTNTLSFEKTSVESLEICMSGSSNYTVTGTIYGEVRYLNKYFLTNALFSSSTQNITLYNSMNDDKSTLQWYLKDNTWDEYPNLIGRMERYYPSEHIWKIVQQDISGEFGELFYHVYEENTEYRFKFYSGVTLYESTNAIKFKCTAGLCEVTSQVSPVEVAGRGIGVSHSYSNATKILTVNWNDPTGATSLVTIRLTKETMTGSTSICNTSVSSASGTYQCNTTGYVGNALLKVRSLGSPWQNDRSAMVNLLGVTNLANYIGFAESGLWTAGILLTIVGIGFTGSAPAVMIMTVAGLIIMYMMGISLWVNEAVIGMAVVIGVIISIIIQKKR